MPFVYCYKGCSTSKIAYFKKNESGDFGLLNFSVTSDFQYLYLIIRI